ncbi:hypothetical protein HK098_005822 [Nowakowskiella sp. JEL0407]|nr:hypothetical protein HK098_005822 [Nowakowskiella sp. JEL0407]
MVFSSPQEQKIIQETKEIDIVDEKSMFQPLKLGILAEKWDEWCKTEEEKLRQEKEQAEGLANEKLLKEKSVIATEPTIQEKNAEQVSIPPIKPFPQKAPSLPSIEKVFPENIQNLLASDHQPPPTVTINSSLPPPTKPASSIPLTDNSQGLPAPRASTVVPVENDQTLQLQKEERVRMIAMEAMKALKLDVNVNAETFADNKPSNPEIPSENSEVEENERFDQHTLAKILATTIHPHIVAIEKYMEHYVEYHNQEVTSRIERMKATNEKKEKEKSKGGSGKKAKK